MASIKVLISSYEKIDAPSIGLFSVKADVIDCLWQDTIEAPSYLSYAENMLFAVTEKENNCKLHMYHVSEGSCQLKDVIDLPIGVVCHIEYLPKTGVLLGSSYDEGILFSVRINSDGFGSVITSIKQPMNDDGLSRVHCTLTTEDESIVYATNIATDRLYQYKQFGGELEEVGCLVLPRGTGPRHLCFGIDESILYVISEYSNETLVVHTRENQLYVATTVKNSEPDPTIEQFGSSLSMSADRKFLYTATRGSDLITVFAVDGMKLSQIQCIGSGGHWPRHISIIGGGCHLAVANQMSGTVVLFTIDYESGKLTKSQVLPSYESVSFVGGFE